MRDASAHLSDEMLMLFADGEIAGRHDANIRKHLAACWSCRLRLRELDESIAEFARMYRDTHQQLPPPEGPRALLKARLHELAMTSRTSSTALWFHDTKVMRNAVCFAAALVILIAVWMAMDPGERKAIPRSDLTPGAVRTLAASDVCRASLSDNADVIPAVQRQVFAEYGMANAEAKAYEVDYLITPALGGSDDIRNLWPQPYSGSAWNAHVKDALEDRLRHMVCAGQLDLATAQHEIAVNWVTAYKKHFRTNRPLAEHQRFRREEDPE